MIAEATEIIKEMNFLSREELEELASLLIQKGQKHLAMQVDLVLGQKIADDIDTGSEKLHNSIDDLL